MIGDGRVEDSAVKALFFDRFGDPEVLRYGAFPDHELDAGSVLVETRAVGLNFADIYRRQGVYVLDGKAPWIGGYEGVGRIIAVGNGVDRWRIGQRVGFLDVPRAHAERVCAPADRLVALPDDIDDRTAAALLLQGVTAQYLVEDSGRLAAGDRVLVQAASGGVGRLLTQMAAALGAEVHALASTPSKREQARSNGASAVYGYDDWVAQVRRATGDGVDLVYDSIGTTLHDSLAALRPGGRVVIFGKAGGPPPAIDPLSLMEHSKGVVGGDLWTYLNRAESRQSRADRLFAALRAGTITAPVITTFPLSEGAAAHRLLEDRSFAGKIVLVPEGLG
ncbi:quinone oxidoreductase [Sphingomonas sp. SORGH_AS_0879]|uniref:quinone oxidoreductase family protein n=1 Tax=Sphingomonas sp. SORGH_AS_0879 TaxID=3041790 RepID=UPI00278015A9|nr:quinone oxidoreductase [Sphingomonas sp. SORGH_AS_0879]MDQ1231015.1 NADPH2:quinone reductase [Sphingomonas sp. SORGH_AS_0879]